MQSPYSPSRAQQAQPQPMQIGKILVRVHGLFDIPRPLTELDAVSDRLEIVLRPRARYYSEDRRVAQLDLREEVIAFSPSNILYKNEKFVVDFDSPMTVDLSGGGGGVVRDGAAHGAAGGSRAASVRSISRIDSTSGVLPTTTALPTSADSDFTTLHDNGLVGGGGFDSHGPGYGVEPSTSSGPGRLGAAGAAPVKGGGVVGKKINSRVLLLFPTREDLKVLIEVVVGVRERRKDSPTSYRWLTPTVSFDALNAGAPSSVATSNNFRFQGLSDMNTNDGYGIFSFAESEVMRHKVVTRLVGLRVGRLSVTASVPYVRDNLNKALYYHECGEPYGFDPASISPALHPTSDVGAAAVAPRAAPSREPGGATYPHANNAAAKVLQAAEEVRLLNTSEDALRRFRDRLMRDAVGRLQRDCERLLSIYRHVLRGNSGLHAYMSEEMTPVRLLAHLRAGESEYAIYRHLLLTCDPNFFARRVQGVFDAYPPRDETLETIMSASSRTSASSCGLTTDGGTGETSVGGFPVAVQPVKVDSNWPHAALIERLLTEDYPQREEDLLRWLGVELGPERSTTSPRLRLIVYARHHRIPEEHIRAYASEVFPGVGRDALDSDPDLYMREVERQYQKAELLPTDFNFQAIDYVPEHRFFFSKTLRFPENKTEEDGFVHVARSSRTGARPVNTNFRDLALAARAARVPLQLTGLERPLVPDDPTRRSSEIDVLLDKYKTEFLQIIPSIADATRAVVRRGEHIWEAMSPRHRSKVDALFNVFNDPNAFGRGEFSEASFHTFLTRLSEYTYISPSSLLGAVIYLDHLALRHPHLCLTRQNVERLFEVMVRISSKVVDLRSVNNKNFANVFQMAVQDMNFFEDRMLKLMDFDFFLSPEEFVSYAHLLDPAPGTSSSNSTAAPAACVPVTSQPGRAEGSRAAGRRVTPNTSTSGAAAVGAVGASCLSASACDPTTASLGITSAAPSTDSRQGGGGGAGPSSMGAFASYASIPPVPPAAQRPTQGSSAQLRSALPTTRPSAVNVANVLPVGGGAATGAGRAANSTIVAGGRASCSANNASSHMNNNMSVNPAPGSSHAMDGGAGHSLQGQGASKSAKTAVTSAEGTADAETSNGGVRYTPSNVL